jgi:hypothetical protein
LRSRQITPSGIVTVGFSGLNSIDVLAQFVNDDHTGRREQAAAFSGLTMRRPQVGTNCIRCREVVRRTKKILNPLLTTATISIIFLDVAGGMTI